MYAVQINGKPESPDKKKGKLPNLVVKDRNYLKDTSKDGFAWNNKNRARGKYYSFYHGNNDKFLPTLQRMEMEEMEIKALHDKARIQRIAENRSEILKSYHDRTLVRKLIQLKSNQNPRVALHSLSAEEFDKMMIPYEKDLVKKAISTKHAVHTDNRWNFLLEHDRKRADLFITEYTVRAEEELVANFQKKIQDELETEALLEKAKHEQIKNFRRRSLKKQDNVMEFEVAFNNGKSSSRLDSSSPILEINLSECQPIAASSTSIGNLLAPGSGSFISNNEGIAGSSQITPEKMVVPPRKGRHLPKNDLERPEFHGLMIRNSNEGLPEALVPVVSTLNSKSQLFSRVHSIAKSSHRFDSRLDTTNVSAMNTTSNNQKEFTLRLNNDCILPISTRELKSETPSKPQKSRVLLNTILKNNLENPKHVGLELDQFEQKCKKSTKYEGFPRSNLGLTVV